MMGIVVPETYWAYGLNMFRALLEVQYNKKWLLLGILFFIYGLIFLMCSPRIQLRILTDYTVLISYTKTRSYRCVVGLIYNVMPLVSWVNFSLT